VVFSCLAGCDVPVDARDVFKVGAAAGTQQDGYVRLRRYNASSASLSIRVVNIAVGLLQLSLYFSRVSDLRSRGRVFVFQTGRYQIVITWVGDCLWTGI